MLEVNSIVIVGGGSAGWMSAATLKKHFPEKNITVIESADVPIVGVGESTIGQINDWLHSLDISEDDFMKYTDASLKLSIKFTDWAGKGTGGFHYPFGEPWTVGTAHGINDWYFKKAWHPDTPVTDFCECLYPQMPLIKQNKITKNTNNELPGWRYQNDVAYHFDATKFGTWLREEYCKPRGVQHIVGTIKEDIEVNEDGIACVELLTGEKIKADLYIDCTGWKSLLLGKTLNVPFESYSDILPNNSAWATRVPYTDKHAELQGYTNCTTIEHGWVWNIPLWSRVGTGYVFSDNYVSKEQALEEFKKYLKTDRDVPIPADVVDLLEFKFIKMRIGIHKEVFHRNVCAIGLAAGFIEPLESNGLYTVHEFLLKLVKTLGRKKIGLLDREGFNMTARGDFRSFAEFVAMHYTLSQRDDTQYWKDATSRRAPLNSEVGVYKSFGFDNAVYHRDVSSSFDNRMGGVVLIATGLNYFPIDLATIKRTEFKLSTSFNFINDTFEVWEANKQHWQKVAENCQSLYSYLEEKYSV